MQALHGAPAPSRSYPAFNKGSAPCPAAPNATSGLPEEWQEKALMYAPLQVTNGVGSGYISRPAAPNTNSGLPKNEALMNAPLQVTNGVGSGCTTP